MTKTGWESGLDPRVEVLNQMRCHESVTQIERARDMVLGCEGTVYFAGNGGSAAMASHLAAELVGQGRSSIALCDPSVLTALGNDRGFRHVFEVQLLHLFTTDLVILLSTSGQSDNMVRAAKAARDRHASSLALLGESGCLDELVTHAVRVPSTDTQLIQEAHLMIGHYITGVSG